MAASATRRGRPDSAARLKALTRRAYTATAGHLDLDDDAGREFDRIISGEEPGSATAGARGHRAPPTRRWAVSGRAVVVVLLVAAALAGVVVARAIALGPSDAVPVPQLSGSAPPGQVQDPTPSSDPTNRSRQDGAAPDASGAPAEPNGGQPGDDATGGSSEQPAVVVHVAGAVHEPGVVELPAGARVAEALEAVGGPLPAAELAAVNLARPVQDGEQVYIPAVGEAEPGAAAGPAAPGVAAPGGAAPGAAAGGAGGDGDLIDLNTADLAALDTLPGVGPAIAERIVEWRATNGPFHSVEELLEVSGIGPATLERLRNRVRV